MTARILKSLPEPDHGYKHREHRSKIGRERFTGIEWARRKELKKQKEEHKLTEMEYQIQLLKNRGWL